MNSGFIKLHGVGVVVCGWGRGYWGFKQRKKMRGKMEDFQGEPREQRSRREEKLQWRRVLIIVRGETEAQREKERSEVVPSQPDLPFSAGLNQE